MNKYRRTFILYLGSACHIQPYVSSPQILEAGIDYCYHFISRESQGVWGTLKPVAEPGFKNPGLTRF